MTDARHTPGPWYAAAQNDALYVTAGRAPAPSNDYPWHDAPRVAIARVFDAADGDILPVCAKANARLIAAAPDLLDALRGCCLYLPDFCADGDQPAIQAVLDEARAAIARATGETP